MNALSPLSSTPPAEPAVASVPTFADAIRDVSGWHDLADTSRRDLTSALTTVARALDLPPAAVPCDVAWLNARLYDRPAASLSFEPGRHRNILSGLRSVLRRLDLHQPDTRGEAGLPATWLALLGSITIEPQRAGLRGFARYCAAQGVEPDQVGDAHLAAFAAWDAATRLYCSADRAGPVARAWNAAHRRGGPDAPVRRLDVPPRREPYTLPFEAYPETFQAEVRSFERRLSRADGATLFGPGPATRRLRPATVKARVFSLRQAAAALVLTGTPAAEIRSLADLVQPIDNAARILDHYHQRAEMLAARHGKGGDPARGSQLMQVAETLRQLGKHHLGLTGPDLAQLGEWARATQPPRQAGLGGKARERLRRVIEPRHRAMLLHLPAELARRVDAVPQVRDREARLLRVAVTTELLLICPMRMRNLVSLRLDRHLKNLDQRGRRITHLVVDGEDTKNGELLEWPIPESTARMLATYLRVARPVLLRDTTSPYLFPGSGTGHLSQDVLAASLVRVVHEVVGVRIHPHLLRHFAAWRHLDANPGDYETVRRLLGHRDLDTTIRSYCGLETASAARRYDATVLGERRASRTLAAIGFGRRPGKR